MNHIPIATVLAVFCVLPAAAAAEETDQVEYSAEGYCILANEGADPRYVEVYARKLGMTPSAGLCLSFQAVVDELRPKDWDYRGRRPYPYSAIRLSVAQIEAIQAAQASVQK